MALLDSLRSPKVVFCDPRYPVSMVEDPRDVAVQLVTCSGFFILGAKDLGAWMETWTEHGGDGSVCVLAHGIAPDTIAEEPSRACLARRYLDSGGRMVWLGDTPFYYQGQPGKPVLWGLQGLRDILDLGTVSEAEGGAVLTQEGRDWGLVLEAETSASFCVPARDVTVALSCAAGGLAGSFLKNYSPGCPSGGFLRLLAGPYRRGALSTGELTRVCLHGLDLHWEEAAAEAAEAYPDPGGALVESGSFRVDRERALEKLRRFQLPDAAMYLLPWVRCAVAGDAKEVAISRVPDGLRMRFGGRPLEARELKDPYKFLFEGGLDGARYRHLAVGLLSAFRLSPERITVESGAGEEGFLLTLDSPHHESMAPRPGPDEDTVITVRWPATFWKHPSRDRPLDYLGGYCDASRCAVRVEGSTVEPEEVPEPGFSLRFDDEGVSGWLEVPREPTPVSKLEVFSWGVRVGPLQLKLPVPQVIGWVSDDGLGLNASQTGVVNDGRLEHAKGVLARQAERLMAEMLDGFRTDFAEIGRLLYMDPSLRGHWIRAVELCEAREKRSAWGERLSEFFVHLRFGNSRRHQEQAALVARCARLAVWLRDAAGEMHSRPREAKSPAQVALWKAPLYLNVVGGPLSLRDIAAAKGREGGIIYYVRWPSGKSPDTTLWRFADREFIHLSSQFGDALTDVTDRE